MTTPDAASATNVAPLSVKLREQTAASHERIETALDLLNDRLTVDRYANLLGRWLGFERTWERISDRVLGDRPDGVVLPPGFLAARRRGAMLEADLLACGLSPAALAVLPAVPDDALPWQDFSAALGTLYVIEGSTLGGQHVAKFVRTHLGLTADRGVAYFHSYGPHVGARWRETKALLDAPPWPIDEDRVIGGAIATFDYLAAWLTW